MTFLIIAGITPSNVVELRPRCPEDILTRIDLGLPRYPNDDDIDAWDREVELLNMF